MDTVFTTRDKTETEPRDSPFWMVPPGVATDLLILAVVWFASLLIVWPVGDFPLNDDWAFARSVKRFLETGTFQPTAWAAMPLLTQTLWGSLFCLPAGFSFNALRCSTLVMSAAGVMVTYFTLRHVHPSRLVAVCGALTVALNPIYFALSYTFMTDVGFTALMMASALFLFRNLNSGNTVELIIGTGFALAATLSRQLALAVPLSFAICIIWTRGNRKDWWARALVPLLLSVGGLLAYQHWMQSLGRLPVASAKMNMRVYGTLSDPLLLLRGFSDHARPAVIYLGWFAFPLSMLLVGKRALGKSFGRWLPAALVGVGFLLLCADDLIHKSLMMPIIGNILVVQGIGPLTVHEAFDSEPPYLPSIGKTFWLIVTLFGVFGGALLLANIVAGICRCWRSYWVLKLPIELSAGVFFLLSLAGYLVTILALGGLDRYYMPALPLCLVGAAAIAAPKFASRSVEAAATGSPTLPLLCALISACLLAFMGVFAVFGTADYLNWNRARWRALNDLMATGKATPSDVDGGFEFNGWYLYDPNYKARRGQIFWWVQRDDYMVAFSEQPGYDVVKEYPYSNWLPPTQRRMLLLHKHP